METCLIKISIMEQVSETSKDNFFYPIVPYHGTLKDEQIIFNTKLHKFAHQVGFIVNLRTSGKISPQEAYLQIEYLWKDIEK